MKKEILEIFENKYSDKKYLNELLKYVNEYFELVDKQYEYTKTQLETLLKKYNFNTIPIFSEYPEYPAVILFKGVDSWTLSPAIDYEGGISDTDNEIGIIFNDPEFYPDLENEELNELRWSINTKIILVWLSNIWFEIEGSNFGIVLKTLENNSVSQFVFNDLAWDDLSNFSNHNDKVNPIESFFKSKPSIIDIFQRVSLETYPVYPYYNRWRYFKKENIIKEFVCYGNETGLKNSTDNIENLKIVEHKTLLDTLKFELEQTNNLVNDGFVEYLSDTNDNTPIYTGAIETKFHSGQHWYYNEQANRIEILKIINLEKEYNIKLPFHFKHYLRLFNGRKYNNINLNFNIGNGEFLKVKEFFNFEELKEILSQKTKKVFLNSIFRKQKKKLNGYLLVKLKLKSF
ncbi:hypothetical protein [Ochrovirga pacifica]|uniref:hypothetical protein n=1 Tax=Ochrovirga pacifica TaxID=1042376 RepID=UPI000255A05E|nr:hypothetical protein [Ochrovirga pacifica]